MERENRMEALERNSSVIRSHRILFMALGIAAPVIVLFLMDNGLKLSEVLLLEALFAITMAVFEVPSGYIADRIGRKRTIIAGGLFMVAAQCVYFSSAVFSEFLIAELLIAVGIALISGADEALLYDSLAERGRKGEFAMMWGNVTSAELLAGAGYTLLGGTVGAAYGFRVLFIIIGAGLLLMVLNARRLTEPRRETALAEGGHMREILAVGVRCFKGNTVMLQIIIVATLFHMLNQTSFWLHQPIFEVRKLPIELFGIAFAIINIFAAFLSRRLSRVRERRGMHWCLLAGSLIAALSGLLIAAFDTPVMLIAVLGFQVIRVMHRVVFAPALNEQIEEYRATVISVANLSKGVVYGGFSIAIGPFVDMNGPVVGIAAISSLFLVGMMLIFVTKLGSRWE